MNLRPERRSDEMDGATCWTYPRNLDRLCLVGNVFVNIFVVATVATSTFSFVSPGLCLELDLVKGYTKPGVTSYLSEKSSAVAHDCGLP